MSTSYLVESEKRKDVILFIYEVALTSNIGDMGWFLHQWDYSIQENTLRPINDISILNDNITLIPVLIDPRIVRYGRCFRVQTLIRLLL